MRFFVVGIVSVFVTAVAFAQAIGEVEAVGFSGAFRPGCWTPIYVRLTPTTGANFTGRLEVIQEDLDSDVVHFTRQVQLTGNPAGGTATEQKFWMYFVPQSGRDKRNGLIESTTPPAVLSELIKVRLCTESGKELIKIPIRDAMREVEPVSRDRNRRGDKFVLWVYDRAVETLSDFHTQIGINETVQVVGLRDVSNTLPDAVIGYEGVDAIVWADADPTKLSDSQLSALEEFVRRGGRLVICQDTNAEAWKRNNEKLALLMPVVVVGTRDARHLGPLRELARVNTQIAPPPPPAVPAGADPATAPEEPEAIKRLRKRNADFAWYWNRIVPTDRTGPTHYQSVLDAWEFLARNGGPFKYAVAQPKRGAFEIVRNEVDGQPYAVRMAVGAGSVTWVAQNLGDRTLLGAGERNATRGWVHVWDTLLDWPNSPVPQTAPENLHKEFGHAVSLEFGRAQSRLIEFSSTSAALIGIAVLFFIGYWLFAGPGSFFVLSRRKRTHLSWFAFGVLAIAATGLTYLIVKLVLRGEPELNHVTLVRVVPGQPAIVQTKFGLYIKRDGLQRLELKETAPGKPSYVTALNLHPAFDEGNDLLAHQDYWVPVKEVVGQDQGAQLDPRTIRVPYRSTAKKFRAQWVGNAPDVGNGIEAQGLKLNARDYPLAFGTLTNRTGRDLRMVYIVFHNPLAPVRQGATIEETETEALDCVLYVPLWKAGDPIDLAARTRIGRDYSRDVKDDTDLFPAVDTTSVFYFGFLRPDRVQGGGVPNWTPVWYRDYRRSNSYEDQVKDDDPLSARTFPILSFYDRLPVSRNDLNDRNEKKDRPDILRRGMRHLDLSSAVSAGNLAVIAIRNEREAPLPFPLEVEGDRIRGKGVVYYQFVFPMDRSAVAAPPPAPRPAPPAAPAAPGTNPKPPATGS